MPQLDLVEQYRICQKRGHQADETLTTVPVKFRCKHCRTVYYYESVLRESETPGGQVREEEDGS